jgi:hypothetical protein
MSKRGVTFVYENTNTINMEKATTKAEMTDYEFYNLQRRAQSIPYSPFAEFMYALVGYDLFIGDQRYDKYEIYEKGFTNAKRILNGSTSVTAVKREERKKKNPKSFHV